MTERKKLGVSKPAHTDADPAQPPRRKPPVRGSGTAPRPRMTAAEAAKAREEAAARHAADQAAQPARRDERAPRTARQDGPRPDAAHPNARRHDGPRAHPATQRTQRPETAPRPEQAPRRDHRRADGRTDHAPRPGAATQPTVAPREDDGRIRLSKLMSEKGLASRREADDWIDNGWVRVDGRVVDELGSRVFPDQVITIDPAARSQQAQLVTIIINKPIGYVSGQAEDGYEPAVVLITPENRWAEDKLPIKLTRGHLRHLAPSGRLDIDSTGMLVLTQDGRVAKALIGEDSGVEKEYLVRVQAMDQPDAENVSAVVPPEAIDALRHGLELDGRQLKPAQVSWQNEQQLRFVLREGRKRQIRRMCEMVGLKVVGLKRVRMGRVTLGKLPLGQWRFLRPDERF